MIPEWLLQWIGTLLGGIALLWLGWGRSERSAKENASEKRFAKLESQVQDIYLKIAGDMPKKEDLHNMERRMESLEGKMEKIYTMVAILADRAGVKE